MASIKNHLRLSALLEGISFLLLLLVAMPLKYAAGMPVFVEYIGLGHGILFIWYIISVVVARNENQLTNGQTVVALAGSVLPFGTFYADNKLFRKL